MSCSIPDQICKYSFEKVILEKIHHLFNFIVHINHITFFIDFVYSVQSHCKASSCYYVVRRRVNQKVTTHLFQIKEDIGVSSVSLSTAFFYLKYRICIRNCLPKLKTDRRVVEYITENHYLC